MRSNSNEFGFYDDTRAVAPVIGFILIFGFLTIAFIGYQAAVVPQQNAETEFEHFQQNQNEMVELRSAVLTASDLDRPQHPTIELGTQYRTRALAVNGPPPEGTIRTSDSYPITIADESGTEIVVQTRFIEYEPRYFEIDVGSTWYEHSVLYIDERNAEHESGGLVIQEDQSLVTSDDTLRLTALQNKFERSGSDRVTLELYPTSEGTSDEFDDLNDEDELTVEMPTRLGDDDTYWENQFEGESAVTYDSIELNVFENDVNKLTLTEIDNVEVNTVGIQLEPDENPKKNTDFRGSDDDGDDFQLNAEFDFDEGTDSEPNPITVDVTDANGESVNNEDITLTVLQGDGDIRENEENQGQVHEVSTDVDGNFREEIDYATSTSPESVEIELTNETGETTEIITYEVTEAGGEGPTFDSFSADRPGQNEIEYDFDVSTGDSDLTEVEVRVEESDTGDEVDTDLYNENNNEELFDPAGFEVEDGEFNGLGTPNQEVDVVFEATDENGNTETERVEGLNS